MLNAKKLLKMVHKWQKFSAMSRRRIISGAAAADHAGTDAAAACGRSSPATIASRGHVFVYTADKKRFMVPLRYLSSDVFRELFKMSEEEFGLPADGPITLPCDADCMENVIASLGRPSRGATRDAEGAVSVSPLGVSRCTAPSLVPGDERGRQLIVYGF